MYGEERNSDLRFYVASGARRRPSTCQRRREEVAAVCCLRSTANTEPVCLVKVMSGAGIGHIRRWNVDRTLGIRRVEDDAPGCGTLGSRRSVRNDSSDLRSGEEDEVRAQLASFPYLQALLRRAMVDINTVCCMCGDIGFPDKLFRCTRCFSRFQHSYCSNYYEADASGAAGFCDWCRSEDRKASFRKQQGGAHAKRSPAGKDQGAGPAASIHPGEYPAGERAKQGEGGGDREDGAGGGRGSKSASGGGTSSRPSGRRYKLLKDVLC
ncbi:hypothetical protein Taro_028355 [Colocasia esculenta]|uniref:PHD-type zinc finger plants domain-containing protein n=1 Tax=Colocasia esculenta TaxID=4460 RepID=A0A843VIC1_COLES|nr:hypothetical protein [Colocasia esculenta]